MIITKRTENPSINLNVILEKRKTMKIYMTPDKTLYTLTNDQARLQLATKAVMFMNSHPTMDMIKLHITRYGKRKQSIPSIDLMADELIDLRENEYWNVVNPLITELEKNHSHTCTDEEFQKINESMAKLPQTINVARRMEIVIACDLVFCMVCKIGGK